MVDENKAASPNEGTEPPLPASQPPLEAPPPEASQPSQPAFAPPGPWAPPPPPWPPAGPGMPPYPYQPPPSAYQPPAYPPAPPYGYQPAPYPPAPPYGYQPAPYRRAPRQPLRIDRKLLTPLAVIAAIVLILAVVASAMVLASTGKSTGSGDGSPDAVTQAWASALNAGNYTAADSYMSDRFISRHGATAELFSHMTIEDVSITSATTNGEQATVRATVTLGLKSNLKTTYPDTWTFALVKAAGSWKIDDISGQFAP
jgi:hypothetical protein